MCGERFGDLRAALGGGGGLSLHCLLGKIYCGGFAVLFAFVGCELCVVITALCHPPPTRRTAVHQICNAQCVCSSELIEQIH